MGGKVGHFFKNRKQFALVTAWNTRGILGFHNKNSVANKLNQYSWWGERYWRYPATLNIERTGECRRAGHRTTPLTYEDVKQRREWITTATGWWGIRGSQRAVAWAAGRGGSLWGVLRPQLNLEMSCAGKQRGSHESSLDDQSPRSFRVSTLKIYKAFIFRCWTEVVVIYWDNRTLG